MPRLLRIMLIAALTGAACVATEAEAGGDAQPVEAYDIAMTQGGVRTQGVLVLTADQAALLAANADEVIREGDDAGAAGAPWMPCTRSKDNAFACALDGMTLSGSFSHGQLSGQIHQSGLVYGMSGTRSAKHYRIVRPLARAKTLALAQAHLTGHQPSQALDLFVKLIEDDRFDVSISSQALVGLVACLQQLKDDPALARRGKDLLARYLTAPPPLDAAHALDLDAAEQDLLWKPWPASPGAEPAPLLAITLDTADRKRQWKQGVPSDSVVITLGAQAARHMRFVQDRRHPDLAGRLPCTAVVVLPDGSTHIPTSAWAFESMEHISIQLSFDSLPPSMRTIARLTGSLTLTQDLEEDMKRIPLKEGQAWDSADARCTLSRVSADQGQWSVTVVETALPGRAPPQSSSVASTGMNVDEPLWLCDAHGGKLRSGSMSSRGDGTTITTTLSFAAGATPVELVHRIGTKQSTRELPFSIGPFELP